MSSKKWFIMLICSILIIVISIAGFNMGTDPFGVYGDKFFDWYSYDFTNNPRVAKIGYLDKHHKEFDSYLIGSSSIHVLSGTSFFHSLHCLHLRPIDILFSPFVGC